MNDSLFLALFQRYCMQHPSFACLPCFGNENEEETLRALGGFLLLLSLDGEIVYSTPNVESYLGFHQVYYALPHTECMLKDIGLTL